MWKNWSIAQRRAALMTTLLLMLAASRILLFRQYELDGDEAYMVWQSFGTLEDVIRWLPYDWPPLSFAMVWAWRSIVGAHPILLRVLPLLLFMLGVAFTYRLGKALFQREPLAWALTLSYSGLGFVVFINTWIRGYSTLIVCFPLALWMTIRYFRYDRRRDGILLGVIMAVMIYTAVQSAPAFFFLGLYTLFFHWRKLLRWWLPFSVFTILSLPLILDKGQLAATRNVSTFDLLPFPQAFIDLFQKYTGTLAVVWAALFIFGAIVTIRQIRRNRLSSVLLIWLIAIPLIVYVLDFRLGLFRPRYLWWLMLGLAIWVTYGISVLPVRWRNVVVAALALLAIAPQDVNIDRSEPMHFEQYLDVLADEIRWGDVIYIDPNCVCNTTYPYRWDYYTRVYLPWGVHFVDDPTGYQRVWYVRTNGHEDEAAYQAVREGRIASKFFGPWDFLIRLYVAPPDVEGVRFENGLRFHGYEVVDEQGRPWPNNLYVFHEAENVRVRLWWSVDEPLDAEYSVALHVVEDNQLVAQSDSAPQLVQLNPTATEPLPQSMTQWIPGEWYVEERVLQMPYPTWSANYMVQLIVYQWWDGQRLSAARQDDLNRLNLFPIAIKAW